MDLLHGFLPLLGCLLEGGALRRGKNVNLHFASRANDLKAILADPVFNGGDLAAYRAGGETSHHGGEILPASSGRSERQCGKLLIAMQDRGAASESQFRRVPLVEFEERRLDFAFRRLKSNEKSAHVCKVVLSLGRPFSGVEVPDLVDEISKGSILRWVTPDEEVHTEIPKREFIARNSPPPYPLRRRVGLRGSAMIRERRQSSRERDRLPGASEAAPVKMPQKAAPSKRSRERPRKDPGGRLFAGAWLPAELLPQLDANVAELRKDAPGASRGDIIAEALRTHRPFRLWLLKASAQLDKPPR
jgi:hypothetical protein